MSQSLASLAGLKTTTTIKEARLGEDHSWVNIKRQDRRLSRLYHPDKGCKDGQLMKKLPAYDDEQSRLFEEN
ncbi:unnamed protein product [Brachionus calyciflorus]|uniref:J domain-containing protein n=1 Tax=Brachionus calyciflorus TaxID=104777 RepID=A0A813U586_9BILA|nr:unnamed protein product [Brachionus calyciflorus]